MDIYINTNVEKIGQLLKEKGFVIERKKNHYSAMYYITSGRYHFMYELIDEVIFCDFHFDNKIHGIGMGADYGRQPEEYFEKNLKILFKQLDPAYKTKTVNWFTRRNKAIITGLRI